MDSITIHGLPRVFSSRSWISKTCWSVVFISACVILSYALYGRVLTYQEKKTLVKIEKTRGKQMNYPVMHICDTDMPADAASMDLKEFPKNCTQDSGNGTKRPTKLFLDGCKMFMHEVNFSCEYDFRTKCQFPKHFTPAKHYYQCFTFNKDGSLIQSMSERNNGVNLLIFKNSTKAEQFSYGLSPLKEMKRGLVIQVNPPGEHMGYSSEKVIYLVPGFRTEISLKKKVFRRLPKPFQSQCTSKTSIKQIIGGIYTEKNCLSSCLFNTIYETCGDVIQEARGFMPPEEYPKTKKFINDTIFYNCVFSDVYLKTNYIDCDCPVPCNETVYQPKVSQRPWRQASLTTQVRGEVARFLKLPFDQVNLEFFNKYMIHLNVYYEDFTTETVVEEELYSRASLLSDFGGLMGLLVGASTISMMEIIWLLIETVISKFSKVAPNAVAAESSGQKPV